MLTAIFFNSAFGLDLFPISAVVPESSTVWFGSTDPGGHVGGEWAYAANLGGAPGGGTYGISSSGLGLFGPGDRFPGQNLQGAASVNGLEYGIVSAADDPSTGNAPVTGKNALISDRVVFTLDGLPAGFDPSLHVGDVFFQYGTDLSEGGMSPPPVIPETRTLALFALGAAGGSQADQCDAKLRHSGVSSASQNSVLHIARRRLGWSGPPFGFIGRPVQPGVEWFVVVGGKGQDELCQRHPKGRSAAIHPDPLPVESGSRHKDCHTRIACAWTSILPSSGRRPYTSRS